MIKKIILLIGISSLILAGCGTTPTEDNSNNTKEIVNEQPGSADDTEVQPLEEPTISFDLPDGKGNNYTLEDFKGKVVLLNFWGTWCPYCVEEMPLLQKTYEEYSDQLEIVAVNVQSLPQEKPEDEVMKWFEDKGFTFNNVFDRDGSFTNSLGITSFPTTFVFDKEGKLLGNIPGKIDDEMMNSIIEDVIKNENSDNELMKLFLMLGFIIKIREIYV